MRMRQTVSAVILLFALSAVAMSAGAAGDSASAQEGRLIFSEGKTSRGEPLTANVGAASIPVPATALPCKGCHGRDGQGRPEGGVRPSNITWFNLSKEYGGSSELGRRYDAYDESSFLRAINEGIDSAGNRLDSSMPKYNISRADARDLVAYLKIIQDDFDPGISADEIVIGTLQPSERMQAGLGNAMIEVMQARFDEVNSRGGVYGRRLKLQVTPFDDRESFITSSSNLAVDERVFALVNVFSSTADKSLTDIVEQAAIPSIAPYTQFPAAADGQHLYTFYLHGGLEAQIEVLTRRASKWSQNKSGIFVFYRDNGGFVDYARNAVAMLKDRGAEDPRLIAYPQDSGKWLSDLIDLQAYPEPVILFVGPSGDLVSLLGAQAPTQKPPYLMLPGFFVNNQILQLKSDYTKRLEMAFITVPGGNEGEELSRFRAFMLRNGLSHDFLNARLFAFGAIETLIESVKQAGKRITRKKLVDSVEDMYGFDAGLNKPISFGSRRRIGLQGAYVVKFDTASGRLDSTGTWVRLD